MKWPRLLFRKGISSSSELEEFIRKGALGGASATGITVTPESALRCAPVIAAVRVIAEGVAALPLILYQRDDDGAKSRAKDHPLWPILHDQPNQWQTSFEFRETMTAHLMIWGNAYAFINRVEGRVRELLPIHPSKVESVEQKPDFKIVYKIKQDDGEAKEFSRDKIFHLRGLSIDGFSGLKTVELSKEAIGLALAMEKHGAKLFANGARLGGLLKHPGKISKEAADRLAASFNEAFSGVDNSHKTALLEEDMDWTQISMSSDDAQFNESRQQQVTEIARALRVPPHMIADLSRATFSNIEHQSLEYVKYILMPWLRRWEQAITRDLLPPDDRENFFAEFLIEGLLRGDSKARAEFYASAIQNGWMSPNEARANENMNARDGGDVYLTPLNMAPSVSVNMGGPPPADEA